MCHEMASQQFYIHSYIWIDLQILIEDSDVGILLFFVFGNFAFLNTWFLWKIWYFYSTHVIILNWTAFVQANIDYKAKRSNPQEANVRSFDHKFPLACYLLMCLPWKTNAEQATTHSYEQQLQFVQFIPTHPIFRRLTRLPTQLVFSTEDYNSGTNIM